jgi:hypothetical protein
VEFRLVTFRLQVISDMRFSRIGGGGERQRGGRCVAVGRDISTASAAPLLGLPSQHDSLYRPHQHPAAVYVQNCVNSTNLHLKLTIIINDGRSRANNY